MVFLHFITSAPTLLSAPIFAALFIASHSFGEMKISAEKDKQTENDSNSINKSGLASKTFVYDNEI